MRDAIDGFLAAPLWAQLAMALFALTFVAMIVGPKVTQLRHRRRFAILAQARGARVTPGHDVFTASFQLEHGGRTFTVRRELRSRGGGASYRGPRGHLLVIETPLSSSRWKLHGIDVAQRGALARLGSSPLRTGDAAFDARFTVWQDGVPVRDGWLDATTRAAFSALFDLPALSGGGTVWVQEGMLQCIHDTPEALDDAGLGAIVEKESDLATALDATAGWRGPTN